MPFMHSDLNQNVVDIFRIGWMACSGIGGCNVPDSLVIACRMGIKLALTNSDHTFQSTPTGVSSIPIIRRRREHSR